jgi:uncharacterized protein DUF5990
MDREIALRLTVVGIPPGVAFAMQRGKFELLPPTRATGDTLVFDFKVRIAERKGGGAPNVLGAYAHGTPDDRFLYLNSGTSVGQIGSPWTRRAKIKTSGISWKLVDAVLARPGAVLEVRIDGKAKDGGPCCATVPLLGGWTVSAS